MTAGAASHGSVDTNRQHGFARVPGSYRALSIETPATGGLTTRLAGPAANRVAFTAVGPPRGLMTVAGCDVRDLGCDQRSRGRDAASSAREQACRPCLLRSAAAPRPKPPCPVLYSRPKTGCTTPASPGQSVGRRRLEPRRPLLPGPTRDRLWRRRQLVRQRNAREIIRSTSTG